MAEGPSVYTMITVRIPTVAAILCAACWIISARAHQTVVSPYTFHQDVAPILRERCARCHADGGVASPLTRYADVKGAAWPIRQALLSGRMPPWPAESESTPFKGAQTLPAREFDVLMTWAAGGTPEGRAPSDPRDLPDPPDLSDLPATPDLLLEMPEPFTLEAGQSQADREIVWPADRFSGKWIRAVDLLPGTPSLVRRATVLIRSGAAEQIVALWVPGDLPQTFAGHGAFKVPARASIVLRVHYQRPAADPFDRSPRRRRMAARDDAGLHAADRSDRSPRCAAGCVRSGRRERSSCRDRRRWIPHAAGATAAPASVGKALPVRRTGDAGERQPGRGDGDGVVRDVMDDADRRSSGESIGGWFVAPRVGNCRMNH
jgi:hypothetical protein